MSHAIGYCDETLVLRPAVEINQTCVTEWLKLVELSLKNSVQLQLEACLRERLDDGTSLPRLFTPLIVRLAEAARYYTPNYLTG